MKCACPRSAYRNCILRASVGTARNFSPARNVRSSTAPSLVRRSLVRTNAPPLPGLTCWNSTILKTTPSTSMWLPFLNWLVEITIVEPVYVSCGLGRDWPPVGYRSHCARFLTRCLCGAALIGACPRRRRWRSVDRGDRADQAIRRQGRRARPELHGARGSCDRLPRAERLGQVDDDAADLGPRCAEL